MNVCSHSFHHSFDSSAVTFTGSGSSPSGMAAAGGASHPGGWRQLARRARSAGPDDPWAAHNILDCKTEVCASKTSSLFEISIAAVSMRASYFLLFVLLLLLFCWLLLLLLLLLLLVVVVVTVFVVVIAAAAAVVVVAVVVVVVTVFVGCCCCCCATNTSHFVN